MSQSLTTLLDTLQELFALITLPTLVGAAIYFGRKLQTLDNLQQTVTTMKNNIKVISNALIASSKIEWDGTLLKDYSPLTLTAEGEQYLAKTHFFEIYDQYNQEFIDYIDAQQPKTKYDVEISAVQSVLLNTDEAFMKPIKVHLYNNPKDSLGALAKVAGVYVRDRYLEQHPEITQ